MALHLCRPKYRFPNNPSLIHLFSTSSSNDDDDNKNDSKNSNNRSSSFNSYFSDVKASLKKQSTQTTSSSSLEEIRKNLSEYRQRSAVPPPTTEPNPAASQSPHHISFQELYKRNQTLSENQSNEMKPAVGKLSFEAIRESLRQMKSNTNTNSNNNNRSNMNAGNNSDSLSKLAFKNSLKPMTQDGVSGSRVIGGTQELPVSVFGREMKEGRKGGEKERKGMNTEFVKMYSYVELGEKLRQLRPAKKSGGGGFSLEELNERLMRLREMEEKDNESRIGGVPFRELRDSLQRLKMAGDDKQKKSSTARLDILGHLGGTPNFMLHPPKEHLVEKANNMSSEEKMKIELTKVRNEFKMSESDCGSARVQGGINPGNRGGNIMDFVGLQTLKEGPLALASINFFIFHLVYFLNMGLLELAEIMKAENREICTTHNQDQAFIFSSAQKGKSSSEVLEERSFALCLSALPVYITSFDKHSLKGLQAMVQRRKKLLKYLRRTDWDSYCFVLSKLGLRDNPDYKA
ncbi:hypothetical protein EZV62_026090 [Acer yangbiense]|uniref:30S ribosomal protein S15, chloroplastic n=1 Tax=Acer yangbiense TaxID=1000413 RepID=A0A5C7GRJ2_9ROSI|nr:hypothetical protein EZV62_026090 [Acer yangbiense]